MIRIQTSECHEVKNVRFSEKIEYAPNECTHTANYWKAVNEIATVLRND